MYEQYRFYLPEFENGQWSNWPFLTLEHGDKNNVRPPCHLANVNRSRVPYSSDSDTKYFYYLNIPINTQRKLNYSAYLPSDITPPLPTLPKKVRDDLNRGTAKILFDYAVEGFHQSTVFFPEIFRSFKIHPEQILYMTGDRNECANRVIPTKYYNFWERWSRQNAIDNEELASKIYDHVSKGRKCQFKAVSMSRVTKPHRTAFAKYVDEHDFSDRINYSYGLVSNKDYLDDKPRLMYQARNYARYYKADVNETFEWIKGHGNKRLHGEEDLDLSMNQIVATEQSMTAMQQSYFHIILETFHDIEYTNKYGNTDHRKITSDHIMTRTAFHSEKSYKGIGTYKPFMILGEPGLIKSLEDAGYDVFRDWIDHSYDEIDDIYDRFQAFMIEVERMINISDNDWVEWSVVNFDRLHKNREHLLNCQNRKHDGIHVDDFHLPLFEGKRLNWSHLLH